MTEGSEGGERRVRRSLGGLLSGVAEAVVDFGRRMTRTVAASSRSDGGRRRLGVGMAVKG